MTGRGMSSETGLRSNSVRRLRFVRRVASYSAGPGKAPRLRLVAETCCAFPARWGLCHLRFPRACAENALSAREV